MPLFTNALVDFLTKEWLLTGSAAGLVATSLIAGRWPHFSRQELEVIWILGLLFTTIAGMERSGLIPHLAQRMERGARRPLKLVLGTFLLAMVVTNDVALLVMVPLALRQPLAHKGRLVILQALAANAGSALTPIGNPQNLFLYWHYQLEVQSFIAAIAPFSLLFGLLFLLLAWTIPDQRQSVVPKPHPLGKEAWIHAGLLLILVMVILRWLPLWTSLAVVLQRLHCNRRQARQRPNPSHLQPTAWDSTVIDGKGPMAADDGEAASRHGIDYPLLATFFCFFGLSDNLSHLFATQLGHPQHVFVVSALASQVMSNVPAALLFADFTDQWRALLWGTNVGGFGTLVASMANLIAWRLYVRDETTRDSTTFTLGFVAAGFVAFFVGVFLYRLLNA